VFGFGVKGFAEKECYHKGEGADNKLKIIE